MNEPNEIETTRHWSGNYILNLSRINHMETFDAFNEIEYQEPASTIITSGISPRENTMFKFCLLMNQSNSVRAKNVMFSTIERYHKRTHNPSEFSKNKNLIKLKEVRY